MTDKLAAGFTFETDFQNFGSNVSKLAIAILICAWSEVLRFKLLRTDVLIWVYKPPSQETRKV